MPTDPPPADTRVGTSRPKRVVIGPRPAPAGAPDEAGVAPPPDPPPGIAPAPDTAPSDAPPLVPNLPAPAHAAAATTPAPRRWRRLWRSRGATLAVLAVVVGGLGEALLFQEAQRGWGAGLLFVAAGLGALAWNNIRETRLLTPRPAGRLIRWRWTLALRLAGIVGALGLLAGSLMAYKAQPDAFFGLQGWLWVAGMALLLVACARWYPPKRTTFDWELPWHRAEVLLFAGLVAWSLFIHLVWLEQIPWKIQGDEYTSFRETLNFNSSPPALSLFTTTYLDLGMPSMWFALAAGFMRLVGPGLAGTRLAIAVLGALLVIPVYGIARLTWGRTAAVLAAFSVTISAALMQYSRISMPDMGTAFWWACCFYLLLRGLRSRRPGDFVWAGLVAGTAQYTHYATRVLPAVLLVFFGYLALVHFRAFRERIGHLILLAVGFLVGHGPLLGYFLFEHPEKWSTRAAGALVIPLSIPPSWAGWVADWNALAAELQRTFLVLSVVGSQDTFYYGPFLLPAEAVLVIVGVGVLLWNWRQPASFLLLLWGGSTLLLSSLIAIPANPNPNLSHWRDAWPVFFVVLALPPALWLRRLRRWGPRAWGIGAAIVAGGLIWDVAANANYYLLTYPSLEPSDQLIRTVQGRFLQTLTPDSIVRVVGCCDYFFDREFARMLAPQIPLGQIFSPGRQLPLPGDPDHELIFLFSTPQTSYIPVFQQYYPGGTLTLLTEQPSGASVAWAYRVPPAQAMAAYGVSLTLTAPDLPESVVWQGRVPGIGDLPPDLAVTYPVTATWSGAFYLPAAGPVQWNAPGSSARAWLLDTPLAPQMPLTFDAGWVPYTVQSRLVNHTPLRIVIQEGDSAPAPIPLPYLWPQPPTQGLAVTWSGAPLAPRVDPFVAVVHIHAPPPEDIYRPGNLVEPLAGQLFPMAPLLPQDATQPIVRWSGELYAEEGDYTMQLITDVGDRAQLTIDHQRVLRTCLALPENPPGTAPVHLTAGWHAVQLDYQIITGRLGVQWFWTPPGGNRQAVPPTNLRYTADPTPLAPQPWPAVPGPIDCSP